MILRHLIPILLLALCILAAPAAAAGGAGTASNPYVIQTPAELQSIQNDLSAYYVLGNDIDMSGYSFTPIGSTSAPFFGSLDGRGYTISNLNIDSASAHIGLFSYVISASLKNIRFSDCTVSAAGGRVGLLTGTISSSTATSMIENIFVNNCTVSSGADNFGGIVGNCGGSIIIKSCEVSNSEIVSTTTVAYNGCFGGGIAGSASSAASISISDCIVSDSTIRALGAQHCGGIISILCANDDSYGVIENCMVINSYIRAGSNYVAGVATVVAQTGGDGRISDCVVDGCIIYTYYNYYAGGITTIIASQNSTTGIVDNCTVRNTLTSSYIGGGGVAAIVARDGGDGRISDCVVDGCTIQTRVGEANTNTFAGGIAGSSYLNSHSSINRCAVVNTTVLGSNNSGGICPTFTRT